MSCDGRGDDNKGKGDGFVKANEDVFSYLRLDFNISTYLLIFRYISHFDIILYGGIILKRKDHHIA